MSEKCSKWNKKCAREQKMCKETKIVQGNKRCAQGTKFVPLSKNEVHKETMGAKLVLKTAARVWIHFS